MPARRNSVTEPAGGASASPAKPAEKRRQPSPAAAPKPRKVRWNILILMGFGYLAVLTYLVVLILSGIDATAAFDTVKELLIALVSGTIAIAKDVLNADLER
jgi:hypothetical protein